MEKIERLYVYLKSTYSLLIARYRGNVDQKTMEEIGKKTGTCVRSAIDEALQNPFYDDKEDRDGAFSAFKRGLNAVE